MSNADDFAAVQMALDETVNAPWTLSRMARSAFQRIKAQHQALLDACSRVTTLANGDAVGEGFHREDDGLWLPARAIRKALGDAYTGGPLS